MKYLYLIINFSAVLIPLIYSFHKRINFIAQIKATFGAILIVAVPFLVWDANFTRQGIWGFNQNYITGYHVFNLPIEEILFFICIPYSCLFTYYVLKKYVPLPTTYNYFNAFFIVLAIVLSTTALLNVHHLYTFYSLALCGLIILLSLIAFRETLYKFTLSYLVLLIPFFIVNGILTGTGIAEPVVWYNDDQNLGIRVLTIPIEDFFYGFSLLISGTILFELFSTRQHATAQA